MSANTTQSACFKEVTALSKVTIYRNGDNILKMELKTGAHIEMHDSREMFEVLKSNANGKKSMFVLVVVPEDCTYDPEVRDIHSSDESSAYTCAEAVVVRSLAHKLLVNFTLKFYKPKRAMKMFNNEQEALVWLLSQKAKHEMSLMLN